MSTADAAHVAAVLRATAVHQHRGQGQRKWDGTAWMCRCGEWVTDWNRHRATVAVETLTPLIEAERDALAAEVEGQTLVARSYEQERDAARSRLGDATAQIKRMAAENARLRAQVETLRHGVNHPYGGIDGCARCAIATTTTEDRPVPHCTDAHRALRAALATTEAGEESAAVIDAAHLAHQREWSTETFGPGTRLLGVLDHIRKELAEIEADPTDLGEWIDVVILAFDGAWRAGWEPQQIIDAIKAKQARNEARTWPDWRTADADKAIEHVRANGAES